MDQMTLKQTACPECGKGLRYRPQLAGKMARCPKCDHRFRLAAANPTRPIAAQKTQALKKRPKVKPAGKAWIGWTLAGAGALALLATVGLGGYLWFQQNAPPELGANPAQATPATASAAPAVAAYGYNYAQVGNFIDNAQTNTKVSDDTMNLEFKNAFGKTVNLKDFRGKNLVLVVTRGYPATGGLCPNCNAQTSRLISNYKEFQNRDAEVLLVFPGPTQFLQDFAKATQASANNTPLPFPILLDEEYQAVMKLGIRGDQAKPSTYILDKTGKVRFAYVGASTADRPSVKAMLTQLDALAKG